MSNLGINNIKKNRIHVAMSTDDNYAQYLTVAVCSILKNLSREFSLNLYVLHQGLSDFSKSSIEQLQQVRNFQVDFIEVDVDAFKKLKYSSSTYISKAGKARFLLPELLNNLDKCIYLDCDLIVRSDLSELWNIDIGDSVFGAVEEPVARCKNKSLHIPDASSYFNSGVLVLSLKKLREIDFQGIVCDFLNNHSELVTGDQDTLNVLFHDQWFDLPMKWNVSFSKYRCRYDYTSYKYEINEVQEALKNPVICHFTEQKKPDSFLCRHPYSQDYLKYRRLTSWKDTPIKDISLKSLYMRFIYFCAGISYEFKNFIRTKFPGVFILLKKTKSFLVKKVV